MKTRTPLYLNVILRIYKAAMDPVMRALVDTIQDFWTFRIFRQFSEKYHVVSDLS